MKKRVWIAAVSVASVIALAGCGTAQPGNGTGAGKGTGNGTHGQTSASGSAVSFPLTVTDEAGHKVTIPKKPTHIASTTEGTDEILSGLVPKSEIALVTTDATQPEYSNIVSFAKGIPAIGNVTAEQVIAVHPDLVLMASYNTPGVVNQIEQAGIPVYEFTNFNSIDDIEKNIKVLGTLVGEEGKADQLVSMMEQKIQAVQNAVKGEPKPTVLDYSSYGFAGGSGTTVNDIITDAGGTNAAANLQGWAKVTDEEIVKMNPDVIIDSSDDAAFKQKLLHDPALKTVNAIRNKQIYIIPGADLGSVSQYIYKAVEDVAKDLHPSANIPT
ncbi:ABC transporter substrate-binding protein [Alicyclobacillus cycloheptanicus]|uniref:Iron complex transport system substrate-binding protein n=1 Tax=Alicyclobacillus cycloheptanicus TaxID=1457 RepID=A0ABT9XG37_9BACL|nr:ABC transporter substrate-binding protein [Alicyclobacillus cycloheptanicus]MDQ0189095.1 iron complex transport system substrate-binding protein [Alicyclobacillus cycloheptanicus]WDM00228.1 ABC transporter substrate-binding protein [Alicyclobacillus cycloheptanicus]